MNTPTLKWCTVLYLAIPQSSPVFLYTDAALDTVQEENKTPQNSVQFKIMPLHYFAKMNDKQVGNWYMEGIVKMEGIKEARGVHNASKTL